ncbi:MAG: hypothetical protein KGQ41_03105 [Alphaproteobacteria bacterium]|nr:hypothetical protein [Alphaproteobacteria bacterium]
MRKRDRITFGFRLSCCFWNMWAGIKAPIDGSVRGTLYGLYLAPKLGTLMNLLTSYIVPIAFGATMGGIGLICGSVACVGSFAEALRQFVALEPYSMPISRVLVDWLPKGS